MSFDGRIEAQITVPSGVSVSATTDLGTSTVTIPSGSYFWTSAGGNTGLLATIAAQLNASAPPAAYPRTAAATNSAIGYGTWTAGYLCDESSGNLGSVYGTPATLTASGTSTYGIAGPRGGTDYAIAPAAGANYFDGGAVFDVNGTSDLAVAWVAKIAGTQTALATVLSKVAAAAASGWMVYCPDTSTIRLYVQVAAGSAFVTEAISTSSLLNEWHVGIATIDRATGMMRIGLRGLTSGTTVVSAQVACTGSFATAANFRFGASAWTSSAEPNLEMAAFYIATGSGAATGLSANLSAALSNFAGAINAAWTASLSTGAGGTGRVSINLTGGVVLPSWSLAWGTAGETLRDIAGFTDDLSAGYPTTAADTATVIDAGTWTAGYLCDEASGNLASAFGTPTTLTASGTATYSIAGPRGGSDTAISLTAGNSYFDGGAVFDVDASTDLVVAWVGRLTGAQTALATYISKLAAAAGSGWGIYSPDATSLNWYAAVSGGSAFSTGAITTTALRGEWHVGIAVIDRGAGTMRMGLLGLTSGTSVISTNTTCSGSFATTATFRLGASIWTSSAEPAIQTAAFYIGAGASYASGMAAGLSTALTNFAAMVSAQTGADQAHGLWIPNCPLVLDGEPRRAPKVSDLRTTTSPTGTVLGLVGNTFYRHKNLKWSHVPKSQVWEQAALYANGSWETFFNETQLGLGSTSWFTPCSPVQIYDHTGTLLGADANSSAGLANGWQMTGVTSIEPRQSAGTNGWTGMFEIALPEIVSSG